MRTMALASAAVLMSGCAGFGQVEPVADLSSDELKGVNKVAFYEDDKDLEYTTLGRVKGLSCKGSAISGSAQKDGAMMQLRIKTVKLGGNGVLYPTCSHDASVDWGNNCWESWVCVGEAIRVETSR